MIRTTIRNIIGGLPLVACIVALCVVFSLISGGKADAATPRRHTVLAYFDSPGPTKRVPVDVVHVKSCGIDDDPFECDVRVHGKHALVDLRDFLRHGGQGLRGVRWHESSSARTYTYIDHDPTLRYMHAAYWRPVKVDARTGDLQVHHGKRMGWVRPAFYFAALNGVSE